MRVDAATDDRAAEMTVAAEAHPGGDGWSAGPDCAPALLSQLHLDRDEAERVADLFKALGDPTRVLILQALVEGDELCVHQLADLVGMSQSSVSHHLRLLRTYGLIRARRKGREVYYRPDDDHVEQLIGVCVEHVAHSRGGDRG